MTSRLLTKKSKMKEQKSIRKVHLRNDLFFILVILVIAAVGMLYLFVFRENGNVVRVTVDGELYGTYSLSKDRTEEIRSGENGAGINRLVIRDGKAYMEYASCPDGICVDHSPIFRDGESIVCLPNRVVITVLLEESEDGPDIVT